jgi:hypothetical protein
MSITRTLGSQNERQCVIILGTSMHLQIWLGAHAGFARNRMRIDMRNDRNVPFAEASLARDPTSPTSSIQHEPRVTT